MVTKEQILVWFALLFCFAHPPYASAQQGVTQDGEEKRNLKLEKIAGSLSSASALYVTSQPLLYVLESGRHRFLVFNDKGSRLDSVGNQGFGNYQFDRPVDIDATNGLKIYVSDYNNGRIQIYDRRLQFLSSVTPPSGSDQFFSYQPTVLTVSDSRELFFYENDSGRLVHYNENGEMHSTIRVRTDRRLHAPADIATYNGQLLIADSTRDVIHFLRPEGQYIKFAGDLNQLKAIATSPKGIWALTSSQLIHMDGSGRYIKDYSWRIPKNPVDLDIHEGKVYLLTPSGLWRGSM